MCMVSVEFYAAVVERHGCGGSTKRAARSGENKMKIMKHTARNVGNKALGTERWKQSTTWTDADWMRPNASYLGEMNTVT